MIESITISENAVIICTFLELSIVDKRAKKNPEYIIPFSNIPRLEYDCFDMNECSQPWIELETHVRASETLFHSDWNWLMPLVKSCYIYSSDTEMEDVFDAGTNHELYMNEIEKVYEACVEFIQWYNDDKQQS
jgi:hypothetical protein